MLKGGKKKESCHVTQNILVDRKRPTLHYMKKEGDQGKRLGLKKIMLLDHILIHMIVGINE